MTQLYRRYSPVFVAASWLLACSSSDAAQSGSQSDTKSSSTKSRADASVEAGEERAPKDAGEPAGGASGRRARAGAGGADSAATKRSGAGGSRATRQSDQTDHDDRDAGVDDTNADEDAGALGTPRSIGSCCSEHDSPGCDNPDLEACVCDKLESCCKQGWSAACSFIVKQKYCQAGVRDCVCGSADGQWQQSSCCDEEWTSTCNTVAELKCGAAPGCN